MRAAGRRVDDEVLTHITPAHSENINFFGSIDVHASSPARPHRLPAPPRQRHPFLTGVRPGTAHTQGVGLRQSTILPPQERRHSKRFLVPPAPPGPPPSNRAALARRPSVLFPFACGRWVAARACADDKRSGARGGLRSGKPHHRQLFPVDARLGCQRRHRLAGAAQPPTDRSSAYSRCVRQMAARAAGRDPDASGARPVRHDCCAALLRLPRRHRGVPGEPLLRVRYQLHPQPSADRGRAEPDVAQPAPQPDPNRSGTCPRSWDTPTITG
jgi:hypothetical protein